MLVKYGGQGHMVAKESERMEDVSVGEVLARKDQTVHPDRSLAPM